MELAEGELLPLIDTQPVGERVAPPPVRDARLLPLAAPLPLPCTLALAEMLGEGEGEGVRDMRREPVLCSDAVTLPLPHWLALPPALVLPEIVREEEEEGGREIDGVRLWCVDWEASFDGETLELLVPLREGVWEGVRLAVGQAEKEVVAEGLPEPLVRIESVERGRVGVALPLKHLEEVGVKVALALPLEHTVCCNEGVARALPLREALLQREAVVQGVVVVEPLALPLPLAGALPEPLPTESVGGGEGLTEVLLETLGVRLARELPVPVDEALPLLLALGVRLAEREAEMLPEAHAVAEMVREAEVQGETVSEWRGVNVALGDAVELAQPQGEAVGVGEVEGV